ncbi:MAG: DUF4349 domain-containing protein [Anaerolineae bacterium]|nr:DUF4349 domain-containing protein [Anaerolineae bacterium]
MTQLVNLQSWRGEMYGWEAPAKDRIFLRLLDEEPISHVSVSGDTSSLDIASTYSVDVDDILSANSLPQDVAKEKLPLEGQVAGLSPLELESRMVVYSVDMSIIVKDTQAAMKQIEQLTGEVAGYVVSAQTTQYDAGVYGSVVIRVPATELDNVLARLEGLALEVRNLNKAGTDVTEEYVDLESRVKVLEAAEQELLELYQTRQADGEVTEILEVYQQLVAFREEIESLTGRMQYLEESAAMARVNINMTPDALAQPVQIGRWQPVGTMRDAFEVLVSGGQFLVDALIWIVIVGLPLGALAGAVIFGISRLLRRRRRQRQRAIETPPETTE